MRRTLLTPLPYLPNPHPLIAVVVLACVAGFVWVRRRRVQRMQQQQLQLALGPASVAGGSTKLGSELSGEGLPSWKGRPANDIDSAEAGISKEPASRPTLTATAVALGPSPLGRSSAASVIPAGAPPPPPPPPDGAEHVAALWASAAQAAAATQQQQRQEAVSLDGDPLLAWVNSQQRAGPPPAPHDQVATRQAQRAQHERRGREAGAASGSSEPPSSFHTDLPSGAPSSRPSGGSDGSPGRRPPLALVPSRRGSAMLSQRGSSALVDLAPWEVKYRCVVTHCAHLGVVVCAEGRLGSCRPLVRVRSWSFTPAHRASPCSQPHFAATSQSCAPWERGRTARSTWPACARRSAPSSCCSAPRTRRQRCGRATPPSPSLRPSCRRWKRCGLLCIVF